MRMYAHAKIYLNRRLIVHMKLASYVYAIKIFVVKSTDIYSDDSY